MRDLGLVRRDSSGINFAGRATVHDKSDELYLNAHSHESGRVDNIGPLSI